MRLQQYFYHSLFLLQVVLVKADNVFIILIAAIITAKQLYSQAIVSTSIGKNIHATWQMSMYYQNILYNNYDY